MYRSTYIRFDSELIPEFDDNHDRLDHYWREIFKVVEDKLGEKPNELKKLIKLCCSMSHGQAGVERGFSETKRIVADRSSLSDIGVKGLKTVREAVRNCGGAENVPLNFTLLNNVKKARAVKDREEREAKRKRNKLP